MRNMNIAVPIRTLSYASRVWLLILGFSLLRFLLASMMELGNDESYYWLYSKQLQWNYFDHPPLVAIGIRIFTFNLLLEEQELFVRLSSIVSCALASWFVYKAVTQISSRRAGWFAVILYNISFYTSLVAGVLVMPDSPQLLWWTFSMWMLARIWTNDRDWKSWLLLGLGSGLCIMSKVHGIFIWTGIGMFAVFSGRKWLRLPQFYAAAVLAILIASPLLFWNIHYDFITWRFHSERVDIAHAVQQKDGFWTELLGQILVNNPVNFVLMMMAVYASWTQRGATHPVIKLYHYIGVPMAAVFLFISMFRDIWPHWSGPAYTTLIPVTAIFIAGRSRQAFPISLRLGTLLFVLFTISWPLIVEFYPGTFGSKERFQQGKGDVSLDRYGWEEAGQRFEAFYSAEQQSGKMPPGTPVVCSSWWGAHFEYYFCNPADIPVIGLGRIADLHQYSWLNAARLRQTSLRQAYCIVASIEYAEKEHRLYDYYDKVELAETIPVYRNGRLAQLFYVYRLSGWKQVPFEEPAPAKTSHYASVPASCGPAVVAKTRKMLK